MVLSVDTYFITIILKGVKNVLAQNLIVAFHKNHLSFSQFVVIGNNEYYIVRSTNCEKDSVQGQKVHVKNPLLN